MPKTEASDRFQGLCLMAYKGSETIWVYDNLPPAARELVRNSSFNICAACLMNLDGQRRDYKSVIENMENMIRCEEVNGEPI
jgi:hypothetical protein